jgi:1-acyl-sn-glycerol-3-phosphate acyltransferase
VARIADVLRAGGAVAVFPEGSTWCGRAQGTFRRAVFQSALDAGVPVQPVRLRYRIAGGSPSTAPAFIGDDSLLASVWRVATTRGLTAEVEVCAPIPPGTHTDRRSLARAAQPVPTAPADWVHATLVA